MNIFSQAKICIIILVLLTLSCDSWKSHEKSGSSSQNPSPMVEYTRQHSRILDEDLPGVRFQIPDIFKNPIPVYVPSEIASGGISKLLLHFHGPEFIPNKAVYSLDGSVLAVSIHLGSGSSVYEDAFDHPRTLETLLNSIKAWCERASVPTAGEFEIYLSSFSAGYGAIRSILKRNSEMIHGLILLDGLHTDYIPKGLPLFEGGVLNEDKLETFLSYAQLASLGKKRMIVTHSEIFPGTYASTTETADYLIQTLGLEKFPVLDWGPGGMQMISRTQKNELLILGFAGNTAPDHLDHLHGLPEFINLLIN